MPSRSFCRWLREGSAVSLRHQWACMSDTIRQVLGVSDDMKLLFGVSFGYPDKEAKANSIRMGRDPIESNPM